MSRISIPTVDVSPEASKPLLAAVKQSLGVVPNLMRLVGHSPAALEGYLSLNAALNKGVLEVGLRERIALAVAEYNGCDYCLSAHDYLGRHVAKLSGAEIEAARDFHADDARNNAALVFVQRVVEQHGRVSSEDLSALESAGFNEAAIVEIVVNVAINMLTNYVNNVARTDIDFPKVISRTSA